MIQPEASSSIWQSTGLQNRLLGVRVPPGLPASAPGGPGWIRGAYMNKLTAWIGRVRAFIGEVKLELRKCAWPSRKELMDSTVVVIVSVVLLSAFVGLSDVVTMFLLELLVR